MEHATHTAETGWSTVNANAMRATCRDCGDFAESWCSETDYVSVRRAQQQSTAWLLETCCTDKCRAAQQEKAS